MSRLFLRIYVRILLALGLAVFAAGLYGRETLDRAVERQLEQSLGGPARIARARLPADRPDDAELRRLLEGVFGLEVDVLDPAALPDAVRARLALGEVVAQVHGLHPPFVYVPLPWGEVVGAIGPLNEARPIDEKRGLVMLVAILGAVAVGLWFLVRPLERDLGTLATAARRLGDGDLAARARVAGREDAVGELARTFDEMAERIEALVAGQRELLRAVSHELRTPLARLRFGLELLSGDEDAGARVTRIRRLEEDIGELDALVAELLTWARLDAAAQVSRGDVDPRALVDEVVGALRLLHPSVDVVVEGDGGVVRVDPALARRAVQNLVSNAKRHASTRVRVHAEAVASGMRVVVDDDGPGVPEADRARILEPFVRLDEARTRDAGGTGLGLAIVTAIARAHGGGVEVGQAEAALGGARFVLVLKGPGEGSGASPG